MNDTPRCYCCGRSMPEAYAVEGGLPVCVDHVHFLGACADCGAELSKSETWLGDVCFNCHSPTEREVRMVLDAGGLIPERKEAIQ